MLNITNVEHYGTYACNSNDISCTINIQHGCSSCTYAKFHCPTTNGCNRCDINCGAYEDACRKASIYSYSCDVVNIIVDNAANEDDILKGKQSKPKVKYVILPSVSFVVTFLFFVLLLISCFTFFFFFFFILLQLYFVYINYCLYFYFHFYSYFLFLF